MPTTAFLFRLDSARDNDAFMTLRGGRYGERIYSGVAMKAGWWIPDYVEVDVVDDTEGIRLTLIELEATEIVARASCRKYLPEGSTGERLVSVGWFMGLYASVRRRITSSDFPPGTARRGIRFRR
jgi:hypothetical protein